MTEINILSKKWLRAWRIAQKFFHIIFFHNHQNLDEILQLYEKLSNSQTEFR